MPESEYLTVRQKIIGIISGKGGVGKTTCTVNLCAALTEMKKNVVAVDTDTKMSGLALQLGMYNFKKTLNDLLVDKGHLYEGIHTHESGLKIIPSSLSGADANFFNMGDLFHQSSVREDIILVDSPPGLDSNSADIISSCTEIIVVTIPEIPSIVNAMKTLSKSMELGVKPLGIIINMYNKNDPNQVNPKEIESVCELPVIGVIPHDKLMRKSVFKREPIVFMNPYSKASVEFKKIASRICGVEYKEEKFLPLKRLAWGFKK